MPGGPGGEPAIRSDGKRSVQVELDEHLHPALLLEVPLVEGRLAQLALLVLLDEQERVALAGTPNVCSDAGASTEDCLEYCSYG